MMSVVVFLSFCICFLVMRPVVGQDRKPSKKEYVEAAKRWSYPLGRSGYRADLPTGSDPELWQKVVKQREENIGQYREQIKKAERGDYTTERIITYVDHDGQTREKRVLENQNGTMMVLANNALLMAQGQTPDTAYFAGRATEYRRYMLARMEYWRTVLPEVANQFAGPVAKRPIVSLRFDPSYKSQADETYWANYLVKNISGKELHNVTLVVKLYHFSTGDTATAHQVYFVPSWKPNRELELSHEFVPVEDNPAIRYYVPRTLKPNQPPNPELTGIAGVVRMDLVVFCDEFRQPAQIVKLPQRLAIVVPELLAIAEEGIRQGHQLGLPGMDLPGRAQNLRAQSSKPQNAKAALERFKAEILAPALIPILQFGEPQSPDFQRAMQYLEDPVAAHAAIQTTARTKLLSHFAPGHQYESNAAEKVNARRLGIIFLKCNADGTAIHAELYDPDMPQLTRRVRGKVVVDRRKNQPLIFLSAVGPANQKVPPSSNVGLGNPTRMKLDPFEPSCQSFALFWIDDRPVIDVTGPMTTEQAAAGFSLLPNVPLEAKPSDPKRLADALKRAFGVAAKSPTNDGVK